MLLECRNCGAPLDIKPGQDTTKCVYCKATSRADVMKTVLPTTPPGWRPPPIWLPPPHVPAESVPLKYQGLQRQMIFIYVAVVALSALGICGGVAASLVGGAGLKSNPGWNTDTALFCSGSQDVTFSDLRRVLPNGGSILATDHCTLTLIRCDLQFTLGIVATGNAHVHLVGGRLRTEQVAIVAQDNAVITLENGAIVEASRAIIASGQSQIDALGGSIVGSVVTIQNAKVLQSSSPPAPASAQATAVPNVPAELPVKPHSPPKQSSIQPTAPPPAQATPQACGCAAGDSMCAMKCNASHGH